MSVAECPSCQRVNPVGRDTCFYCGAKLATESEPAAPAPEPTAPVSRPVPGVADQARSGLIKAVSGLGLVILAVIILEAADGAFSGLTSDHSQSPTPTSAPPPPSQSQVIPKAPPTPPASPDYSPASPRTEAPCSVLAWCFTDGYVIGTVKNNTSTNLGYVQIDFNLYDESGNQVGSTFDNINNLDALGTWEFKAIIIEKNATSAKFVGLVARP